MPSLWRSYAGSLVLAGPEAGTPTCIVSAFSFGGESLTYLEEACQKKSAPQKPVLFPEAFT